MSDNMKVLLPLIRRVMPNIIANDILGVQPMSDAFGKLFILQEGKVSMMKVHYQHFVRVPNRKKWHRIQEMSETYKYPAMSVTVSNAIAAKNWCRQNLKEGSWISINAYFVFAYEQDASWFGLVWN